jgi:hypothetical protein
VRFDATSPPKLGISWGIPRFCSTHLRSPTRPDQAAATDPVIPPATLPAIHFRLSEHGNHSGTSSVMKIDRHLPRDALSPPSQSSASDGLHRRCPLARQSSPRARESVSERRASVVTDHLQGRRLDGRGVGTVHALVMVGPCRLCRVAHSAPFQAVR